MDPSTTNDKQLSNAPFEVFEVASTDADKKMGGSAAAVAAAADAPVVPSGSSGGGDVGEQHDDDGAAVGSFLGCGLGYVIVRHITSLYDIPLQGLFFGCASSGAYVYNCVTLHHMTFHHYKALDPRRLEYCITFDFIRFDSIPCAQVFPALAAVPVRRVREHHGRRGQRGLRQAAPAPSRGEEQQRACDLVAAARGTTGGLQRRYKTHGDADQAASSSSVVTAFTKAFTTPQSKPLQLRRRRKALRRRDAVSSGFL